MQLNINKGKIFRAQKVVIYGPEGIGKSTLASQFPDPLYIDTEGGSAHLDVARVECAQDWNALIETVKAVAEQDVCKTLIIDTVDWAEQLCTAAILKKYRQTSIEGFGYGKGFTYLAEEMAVLLYTLDEVIASGKNVVLTAHAKMRKQELPDEAGAFDRWEMKLSRNVSPLVKEWADMVLFLNYKTFVVKSDTGSGKAHGGQRVIYTTHHPCWDAKNRHGLPEEMPLRFDELAAIFDKQVCKDYDTLKAFMARDNVTEEQIRTLLSADKAYKADKPLSAYASKLVAKWDVITSNLV